MCSEANVLTRRTFVRTLLAMTGTGMLTVYGAGAAAVKRPLPVMDLRFLDRQVTLKRRGIWTSAEPRTWLLREAGVFSRITVHHQGAGQACSRHENAVASDIDGVFGGHRRIGYADIGYHFVVDFDGRVWEARSLAYVGAHVSGQNDGNIGVLVLGNFNLQKPSTLALDAVRALTGALRTRFSIAADQLYGHRDLGASLCPGRHLYDRIVKMRGVAIAANKQQQEEES
jgi:hypothetical protein